MLVEEIPTDVVKAGWFHGKILRHACHSRANTIGSYIPALDARAVKQATDVSRWWAEDRSKRCSARSTKVGGRAHVPLGFSMRIKECHWLRISRFHVGGVLVKNASRGVRPTEADG